MIFLSSPNSSICVHYRTGIKFCGWDLAEWLERPTVNAEVATVLGFDPLILRHSGIWGAADKAVLNTLHRKKRYKIPVLNFVKHKMVVWEDLAFIFLIWSLLTSRCARCRHVFAYLDFCVCCVHRHHDWHMRVSFWSSGSNKKTCAYSISAFLQETTAELHAEDLKIRVILYSYQLFCSKMRCRYSVLTQYLLFHSIIYFSLA